MSRITWLVEFIFAVMAAIFLCYTTGMAIYYSIRRTPYDWKFLVLRGLNISISFGLVISIGVGVSWLVRIVQAVIPDSVLVGIAYPFWFVVFYSIHRLKRRDSNRSALRLALFSVVILVSLYLVRVYADNDISLDLVIGGLPTTFAGTDFGFPFFSWGQQPQEPLGARSS